MAKNGSGAPPPEWKKGVRNFRREKRSHKTHASTTDPDARLFRKGHSQSSRLCFKRCRVLHVLALTQNERTPTVTRLGVGYGVEKVGIQFLSLRQFLPAKALSRSGRGWMFPFFPRLMGVGLGTDAGAKWPRSGLSGSIFSKPDDSAVWVNCYEITTLFC